MTNHADATVINDRYEIHKRIGRGGMADVFSARDLLLDRQVAIKVLFPEFATDESFVERFRREAQSAANLSHPNIVNVYDWGKYETTYFIAMEEVQGRTLADILKTNKQLTSKQAAEVASEVAAALGFAHEKGVAHRDIKPANILIGSNGQVKVADFGIARVMNAATESNLTQVGSVMGTATYFSPEQAQGAQPDPRSDLYSLGVVMYEMVAGRPPFTGENPVSIAYKQVHDAPQPLVQIVADVPKSYEAMVAKLLAKDPKLRYPSAGALRDDLRRFRHDEPVQALVAASAKQRPNGDVNGGPHAATTMNPVAGGAVAAAAATTMQPTSAPGTAVAPVDPRSGQVPSTGMYDAGYPIGASSEAAYYDAGGSRTGWYALGAFIALVALVVGGVLLYQALSTEPDGAVAPQSIILDDYANQDLGQVTEALRSLGLQPRSEPLENGEFAPNQVITTEPPAGTVVLPDEEIVVFFNPSPELVQVPNLIGLSLSLAEAELSSSGLTIGEIVEQQSDTQAVNQVLATDPEPNTPVSAGTEIDVVVASAPDTVIIPRVIGLDEASARQLLEAPPYEFTVVTQNVTSDTIPAGEVLAISPEPSEVHPKRSEVTITVSAGPAPVVVPPVEGLVQGQATNQLRALGLVVEVIRVEVAPGDSDDGRVIDQSPGSSAQVSPGSTVTITVGFSSVAVTTVPPTTSTTVPPTTVPPLTPAPPTTAPPTTAAPATAPPSTDAPPDTPGG